MDFEFDFELDGVSTPTPTPQETGNPKPAATPEPKPVEKEPQGSPDSQDFDIDPLDSNSNNNSQQSDEPNNQNDSTDIEEQIIYADAEGNITDKTGKVLIKKDDIKKDENGNIIIPENLEDTSDPARGLVSSLTGYFAEKGFDLNDSQGKPIQVEPTPEGIQKLAETISEQLYVQRTETLFEQFPDVKQYIIERSAGKTREEILAKPSYRATVLDPENDYQLENLVKTVYSKKLGDEKAQQYLEFIKSKGDLIPEAKSALESLKEEERLEEEKILNDRQTEIEKQKQQQIEYSNKVVNAIQEGKLSLSEQSNVQIPTDEREKFLMYLSKRVDNNGKTQAMIDRENESLDRQLVFEYLRFKQFDLNKFVQNLVRTQKVKEIKQKVVTIGQQNKGAGFSGNPSYTGQDFLIDV